MEPPGDWNPANYAPVTIGGAFLLFGGWWVLSASKWFKGPVRMGTDDELEQLEAKQESEFLLPADTEYGRRSRVSRTRRGRRTAPLAVRLAP